MTPLFDAMGWLLAFFYSLIPNLGISIILLTLVVMLCLFPLTAKQTQSMIAMQRVQPEIKKIQQQYKDDRQKQNEELLKFYQENKINPLSGCLPLIIQMPILIALYQTLQHIENRVPKTGRFNDLYLDLCGTGAQCVDNPRGLTFLGMDMLVSPADSGSITDSFIQRLPYFLAVAAVMAAGWYQQYQTLRRQKASGSTAQNNPMMKQMMILSRVFPIMFGYISYITKSGLVVYFLTSSLFRIGQQHFVLNKYYENATPLKNTADGGKGEKLSDGATLVDDQKPGGPSPHTSRKKRKRRR